MERNDWIAIPVLATLGILIGFAHEAWNWGDTLTFVVGAFAASTAAVCLWHVDWRPLRRGSRPRMHY